MPLAPEQVEVVVFGPGFGESICVHVGHGKWLIIDSCFIPKTKDPAAITYLKTLGVNIEVDVIAVIATHWDNDHCAGLAQTVRECAAAKFCISEVFTNREFMMFATHYDQQPLTVSGSRTNEFVESMLHLRETNKLRTHLRQAKQGQVLAQNLPGSPSTHLKYKVTALSPSDQSGIEFLARVAQLIPTERETQRPAPDIKPNNTSVVVWIEVGPQILVFGGDLEEVTSSEKGWKAIILADNIPGGRASVFKIPHHGSSNGHNADMWTQKLVEDAVALVTPWGIGGGFLPTESDTTRISSLTKSAFLTSQPVRDQTPKRPTAVTKQIRDMGAQIKPIYRAWGAIRLRSALQVSNAPWSIELLGAAKAINDGLVSPL